MLLPPPRAKLSGAVWFARIRAKARLLKLGELPPDYAARFCHPTGVDVQFLGFFKLVREDLLAVASGDDAAVGDWFLRQPGVSPERIDTWNALAVNLGRPGFPMAERLQIAKATSYAHVASDEIETVFGLLEADEGVSPAEPV
jgi:hypothetical protein